MKNKLNYFIIAIFFLTACRQSSPSTETREALPIKKISYTWKDANSEAFPKISAHRGGMDYAGYPENSIETIEYVVAKTGAIIECDIAITDDGQLILMHDHSLERTTTCSGKVKSKDWSQIEDCKLRDPNGDKTNYEIPLFEELMDWADDHGVLFTLDIKQGVPYEDVLDIVRKYNYLDRAAIITYNIQQAMKIHRLEPDAFISIAIRNEAELKRAMSTNIPTDRMIAFTGTRTKDKSFYQKLDNMGIPAILGTLGNLDSRAKARGDNIYQSYINDGVDILATNRPLEAFAATLNPN